ncbi:MAG: hypothetical protein RIQ38_2695 [Pseudomonadota bacterium]|jgi:cell division protein FtsB
MSSRWLPVALLAVLLLVLQGQLWLGQGGLRGLSGLQQQLDEQTASNDRSRRVNEQLSAEVNDLKEGLNMVEERARMELGMVRPNEVYVQLPKSK